MSQNQELPFTFQFLSAPENPWGPPKAVPVALRFHDIPYAPFSKSDKLGKASDWFNAEPAGQTQQQGKGQRGARDPFHAYGASAASKFAAEGGSENVNDFEVVDSKASTPAGAAQHQQQKTVLRGRGLNKRGGGQRTPAFQRTATATKKAPFQQSGPQTAQQLRVSYWNAQNQSQIEDASKRKKVAIDIKSNYFKITDVEFSKLTKLNLDLRTNGKGETLGVRANPSLVRLYNRTFDKLSSSSNLNKKTAPLKVYAKESPDAYVDTLNDDILLGYAKDSTADVLVTDEILTTIMAAHKSNFPWNVKITKDLKTNKLYFSQTENRIKTIVDENDQDLFHKSFHSDDSSINGYLKLAQEHEAVNYNLEKFVSAPAANEKIEKVTGGIPVTPSADVTNNKIHKYKLYKIPEVTHVEEQKKSRKLTLAKQGDNEEEVKYINIVVRTEASLFQKSVASDEFETVDVHALNQYRPSQLDWKTKLISNRGAIISTELRKNNNLFSKWIINSILGDVDHIKLGFVARDAFTSAEKHSVLGIFNYKPEDLARQSNLQISNGWAIFKSIVDIANHEASLLEGARDKVEFILTKDPSNAKLTIYRVD